MKRKNINHQVSNTKRIITSYISKKFLPILDIDQRYTNDSYGVLDEDQKVSKFSPGYTGVTIEYIRKYLFDNKINKDILIAIIMDLLKEEILNVIYCVNVKDFVFECRAKTTHSLTTFEEFEEKYIGNTYFPDNKAVQYMKKYNVLKSDLFGYNKN